MKHYLIKGVNKNLQGYNGFQYPWRGYVEAPDWTEKKECQGGLFGIDETHYNFHIKNDVYIIIEHDKNNYIELENKIKIKQGTVVYLSKKISYIQRWLERHNTKYIGSYATITGGDYSEITGGNRSKITGGDESKITGGDESKIAGGNYAEIAGGYRSEITGGYGSEITGGHGSEITGGHGSEITGGSYATITCGDGSKIICGDYATITVGSECSCIIKGKTGYIKFQGSGILIIMFYSSKKLILLQKKIIKKYFNKKYKAAAILIKDKWKMELTEVKE